MRLVRQYSAKSGCSCSQRRNRVNKIQFDNRLSSYYAKQVQDLMSDYDGHYMASTGDFALAFTCETTIEEVDKCKFAAIDIESGKGINTDVTVLEAQAPYEYVAIVPDKGKNVFKVYGFLPDDKNKKMLFSGELPRDMGKIVMAVTSEYLIVENPKDPKEHWLVKIKKNGRPVIEVKLKKGEYKFKRDAHEIEIIPEDGKEISVPYSNRATRAKRKYYSSNIRKRDRRIT